MKIMEMKENITPGKWNDRHKVELDRTISSCVARLI